MIDSKTTQDFISLLPLTLTLRNYAATEKISDLPRRLSTENAPPSSDPSVGDITYYAPWGNLALFYRDFGYSSGLVILGKIDSGIEAFNVRGSLKVTIELAANPNGWMWTRSGATRALTNIKGGKYSKRNPGKLPHFDHQATQNHGNWLDSNA